MNKKYYITTAIAYTSSKPHVGNTYEAVLADAVSRFKKAQGYEVFFQTGSDEHGQKIEEKAKAVGKTPKQFVDEVSTVIKNIWKTMNVDYDKFIRTTDDYHEKQVQKIFKKFYEQGDIYKSSYEGWYCTPCESFWTESQLVDSGLHILYILDQYGLGRNDIRCGKAYCCRIVGHDSLLPAGYSRKNNKEYIYDESLHYIETV